VRDTIDMAQEAQISDTTIEFYQQELKAFEALVRADEREACAKVCDEVHREYDGEEVSASWIATAIRARGQQ
jgi:site-specific recombinase XerD